MHTGIGEQTYVMNRNQIGDQVRKRWQQEPLEFQKLFWPNVKFYDKQIEIIESVRDNFETYVTAGNQLGKDYVAGFIALYYFIVHDFVRVVTTSVAEKHLIVLWDEIGAYIRMSKIPLMYEEGGPLKINQFSIRKTIGSAEGIEKSYLIGQVSERGEKMAGHHAPYNLLIVDEASGVHDKVYENAQGWMKRSLIFGNPNQCNNFFKKGIKAGDLLNE